MNWRVIALVAGVVAAVVLYFLLRGGDDASARTRDRTSAERTTPSELAPSTPEPVKPPSEPTVVASVRGEPPPAPAQAAPRDDRPTDLESFGYLHDVYDLWSAAPEDVDGTRRAVDFFEKQWGVIGKRPQAMSLLCTNQVCRGRFAFEDTASLYRMRQIPQGDNFDVVMADPEVGPDGSMSIVVYWAEPGTVLKGIRESN